MLLEWWSGTECTLYTDQATVDMFGKEHVIIILNHNFEIDFLCGWTICERYGVLGVSDACTLFLLLLLGASWSKTFPVAAGLQSAGQTRAAEGPSDRLDLVLSRNRFLQEEVGGGPRHGLQRPGKTQRLSRVYVGRFLLRSLSQTLSDYE